jgi:hypothetical protein
VAAKVKREKSKDQEFIDTAVKRLKKGVDAVEHNITASIEDLRFLNGDQWDEAEKQRRKIRGRPALQINLLPKYVDQVVGEERENRPRCKVKPRDSRADVRIAKIREGIIWDTEYQSNAEAIYDFACEMQTSCGYGGWRILTRKTEENPFLQEIYMESVKNPFLVIFDPKCKDAVNADAKWAFILEKIPRDEFEEEYPGHELPGEPLKAGKGQAYENWFDEDTVTVAEYFVVEEEKKTVCLMQDGEVLPEDEAKQKVADFKLMQKALAKQPAIPPTGAPGQPQQPEEPKIVDTAETIEHKVKHYVITALEILEGPEDFPGKYIPLVVVKGKERNIEGKTYVRGLIRDAKDPQRLMNYWETSGAEVVALAPKSPWIGTAKQFEGYENDFAAANTENFPYLKYNPDGDAPPPSRVGMGDVPVAIFTQTARAEEHVKATIGMYNADMGDKGPERTGAAIRLRQKPGDVSTFAFIDNLSRAIAHSGKIINEMIPYVYDTERDVRLRNVDDTEAFVPVNTSAGSALERIQGNPERYAGMNVDELKRQIRQKGVSAKYNDLTVGKYNVVITIGPSYTTAREEASTNMLALVQANPKLMQIAGDLVVQNMDFKDADVLADRLRKLLPPGLVQPRPGEPPVPQMPPPPQVQVQMAKLKNEEMRLQIEKTKLDVAKLKLLNEVQNSKGEHKKLILSVLSELFAPTEGEPSQPAPPQGWAGGGIQ